MRYGGLNWLNRAIIAQTAPFGKPEFAESCRKKHSNERKRRDSPARLSLPATIRSTEVNDVYYRPSAAIPALPICTSSEDLTPDTPTAPTTWPSTTIGTPPSSRPSREGADRKETRPLLIMSS